MIEGAKGELVPVPKALRETLMGLRIFRSSELFAEAKEIVIQHDGDLYRLRCTSKGKLILTK